MPLAIALLMAAAVSAPPKNWNCAYDKLSAPDRGEVAFYLLEGIGALLKNRAAGLNYVKVNDTCSTANSWTDAQRQVAEEHVLSRMAEDYAINNLAEFEITKAKLEAAYAKIPVKLRVAAEAKDASGAATENITKEFVGNLNLDVDLDEDSEADFYSVLATYLSAHKNLMAGR